MGINGKVQMCKTTPAVEIKIHKIIARKLHKKYTSPELMHNLL